MRIKKLFNNINNITTLKIKQFVELIQSINKEY